MPTAVQPFMHKQITMRLHGHYSAAGHIRKITITNKQFHYFSTVYFEKDLGKDCVPSVLKYISCNSEKWTYSEV
jgi:CRISPR/Cas system-associated protein endoribonuclease Cas2